MEIQGMLSEDDELFVKLTSVAKAAEVEIDGTPYRIYCVRCHKYEIPIVFKTVVCGISKKTL